MRRILITAGLGVGSLLLLASPASAKVNGPCTGSGTFESQGKTYDAATTDDLTLPAKDTVSYKGAIETTSTGARSHHGKIELKLPSPLPSLTITSWKSASTTKTTAEGVHDYDLPSIVPRGVKLDLTGEHIDTAGTCTGTVRITIDGGPFDAPAPTSVALAGTVVTAAGLAFAARPKGLR
jgi:hypothetical protein